MKKKNLTLLMAGILLIGLSFGTFFVLNLPTVGEKAVSFSSSYNGKSVTLKGSYWSVADAEYAVLICPGYSCDRQKWRPMADLFVSNGFSAMTFDYSGQGSSLGTIGFDNAKNDSISVEIDDALTYLHEISNIPYDHILLVGHSMGGRAILRLLYDYNSDEAVTTVTKKDVRNVLLFSPEVNYLQNTQASLFAGTSDADEDPWKNYDETCIAGTDVYLYGSTADDTVKEEDCIAIYRHLGGTGVPDSGKCSASEINSLGSKITLGITGGVLHSYIMYSPEFAAFANEALQSITGREMSYSPASFLFVYIGWILALAGILILLIALNRSTAAVTEPDLPIITDIRKFLLHKLLLWLPGILVAFLVCCLCVVMPFGSPVMNIPYMCFIAGYGILLFFLYQKNKIKGVSGTLPKLTFRPKSDKKSVFSGLAVAALVCFFVWYVLRASMYRLIPVNFRLFWVLFATVLMSIGYYISGCESDMLLLSGATKKQRLFYNIIQYIPLLLFVSFYLFIGSYSGLIGQAQNMVLMYIFCVPMGNYIKKKTQSRLWGAAASAFLFQALMITSAALISFF